MKNNIFFLSGFLISAIFMGCADQRITFEGTVYRGVLDSTTTLVAVGSPISGAIVREKTHPEKTTTGANGRYRLEITVPGVIGYPNAKQYTIESTWLGGGDVDIVYARPGENIYVRDMVIYQLVPNPTK
ncbi:MAG: hypothetical protein DDT19_02404 [Syntrophomonadaceae bacterium]|nr:hypothetical protein [Bacillota bacterium]